MAKGRTSAKKASSAEIVIKAPNIRQLKVTVVGTTPLIQCAWGKKLGVMEEDRKQKDSGTAPKKGRTVRDPMAECKDAIHWLSGDQPAIPAIAFKRAMVDACRLVEGLTMVQAKGLFIVLGELLPVKGKWHMRKDAVRVPPGPKGAADVRYRPEWPNWEVELTIEYNANLITAEQLMNLLLLAGVHQGVGEQRLSAPDKPFNNGCFTIKGRPESS